MDCFLHDSRRNLGQNTIFHIGECHGCVRENFENRCPRTDQGGT